MKNDSEMRAIITAAMRRHGNAVQDGYRAAHCILLIAGFVVLCAVFYWLLSFGLDRNSHSQRMQNRKWTQQERAGQ